MTLYYITAREYADNIIKPIWCDYAAPGYELPQDMNCIAINRTGNKRSSDLPVSAQTKSLLESIGSLTWLERDQTLSSVVQKLFVGAPRFLDHVPDENDSGCP
ncbi:hypothetical protein Barb6XT_02748 [Bacteroidales bacterium Barb6XT]|nr:hypothetical protein Barb6XT_02748 [Bacteroidales bacterium Barb6XT]